MRHFRRSVARCAWPLRELQLSRWHCTATAAPPALIMLVRACAWQWCIAAGAAQQVWLSRHANKAARPMAIIILHGDVGVTRSVKNLCEFGSQTRLGSSLLPFSGRGYLHTMPSSDGSHLCQDKASCPTHLSLLSPWCPLVHLCALEYLWSLFWGNPC